MAPIMRFASCHGIVDDASLNAAVSPVRIGPSPKRAAGTVICSSPNGDLRSLRLSSRMGVLFWA